MKDDVSQLTLLGSQKTEYKQSGPNTEMLETFPNSNPGRDYVITHVTKEFTSLCPKTGQPDFASIEVQMIADQKCIESKSLKLYFFAYRNEGTFMETITNNILSDLVKACEPRWCQVLGTFAPRGGIQTIVKAEYRKS